ncbi:ectoine hydroxylase [Hyphomonas sp.]|uniref:ectoine hydroxylase n=1 Tax=Hyphomonas sp. TaxID=87 RepID=UPI003919CA0F
MKDLYPSRRRPAPEWLERRDPVLRGLPGASPPIDPALIEGYARDGFAVLEGVFSPLEIRDWLNAAKALRTQSGLIPESRVSEPGAEGAEAVRSVFAPHQQSKIFARLAADARLAGLARYILGGDVYIHQSRINYKPAFRGRDFYWHSDFETWHTEDGMPRMRAVSMSVMLTDNHPQSGPTMFIPGSHETFVACVGKTPDDHYRQSLRKQETGTPDTDSLTRLVQKGGIAAPAPKAGSVVIFDCNTMHGSSSNITPFERINAFFVFNAWDNQLADPFGGTRPRPEFVARRNPEGPIRPVRLPPPFPPGGR